jgi:hypothetical protein
VGPRRSLRGLDSGYVPDWRWVVKRILPWSVLAATLLVACACNTKFSEHADRKSEALTRQIQEEIKTLGSHEWAGDYYYGDGTGVNVRLMLAPESGYRFTWHGCLGLYDRNYGAVTAKDGRLRLSFTFPNQREGCQGIAEEFIVVPWGDRTYLVPSDDVAGFCNEVNDGSEPREGEFCSYLLRRGDETKKVTGFPSVPREFQPSLLVRAIEAEIIGVGKHTTRPSVCDWKFKDTPVTLNCGKKQGLLPGMEMHVVRPENTVESVKINQVKEDRSEAVMTQIGEEEPGPQVGWKLSTRCPWHIESTKENDAKSQPSGEGAPKQPTAESKKPEN